MLLQEPVVRHTIPACCTHLACRWHFKQGAGEAAGREGVKTSHNYQFETFSKIATFLLFAEFAMFLQCSSHYSFLSQNNTFKQRNDLSREKKGSAGQVGQLHAPVSAVRGIQYFRQFCFLTGKPVIPSWQPLLPGAGVGQCAHAVHCFYSPT